MKSCLTIAGSDSGGGAGIQADLKTFAANKVYGTSVITALTAQNTLGVQALHPLPSEFVEQQLHSVLADIPPDAVKIGMLASPSIVQAVAKCLSDYSLANVVLDPVMVASSGTALMNDTALHTLVTELLPRSRVITPNVDELLKIAPVLGVNAPKQITQSEQLRELGWAVYNALPTLAAKSRPALLLKGGHMQGPKAQDWLIDDGACHLFSCPRVDNRNNHGTGCTLSSAIAAQLANGRSLKQACENAKQYLQRALEFGLDLGAGCGPLNHQV